MAIGCPTTNPAAVATVVPGAVGRLFHVMAVSDHESSVRRSKVSVAVPSTWNGTSFNLHALHVCQRR